MCWIWKKVSFLRSISTNKFYPTTRRHRLVEKKPTSDMSLKLLTLVNLHSVSATAFESTHHSYKLWNSVLPSHHIHHSQHSASVLASIPRRPIHRVSQIDHPSPAASHASWSIHLTLRKSDFPSITMARCNSPLGRHVYIAAAVLMCTIALLLDYAQADVSFLLAWNPSCAIIVYGCWWLVQHKLERNKLNCDASYLHWSQTVPNPM